MRRLSPTDAIALAIVVLYIVLKTVAAFGRQLPLTSFVGFLAFLAAAIYFVFRILPWIRTGLLWRLRNRLIVAYVFIAVVPVILLVSMAGLSIYLFYLQLGAHRLRDGLDERINAIAADTDAVSDAIQTQLASGMPADNALFKRPPLATVIAAERRMWPDLQVFLNQGERLIRPGTQRFSGLVEFQGKLWLATAESHDTPNGTMHILAGVPITSSFLDGLSSELGPIQLSVLQPSAQNRGLEINGIYYAPGEQIASHNRTLPPKENWLDIRVNGASTFEAAHADSGSPASVTAVLASFSLRPMAINRQLFTSVGAVGPLLVSLLVIAGIVFLILEIAALATGIVLTRTITRAVGDLYDATLHVRRGDLGFRVRVHKRDQLGSLGDSFNEMTSSVSDLIAEQRTRQRLEHEISIAREVQEQLFPRVLPSIPGLQVAATCRPARTVSGDYYDFINLSPTRVGIAIADISGKGIFAALLMASLQAALRSMASLDGCSGTAPVVARLNNHVFKNTSDDRYATFFYAVYDTESHTLTYTNAGHLAPFFLGNGKVQQLDEGGTVVGLFEDAPYTQGTITVVPGSVLVAFSDGLTEAENVYGEEFGMQRLREEIVRHSNTPALDLAAGLIAATDQWAGTPEQADDITVVVARMN